MARDETLKPRKGSKKRARRPKRTKADRGEPKTAQDETLKPRKARKSSLASGFSHPPFREGRGGSLLNHYIASNDGLVKTEVGGNERTRTHVLVMSEPLKYLLERVGVCVEHYEVGCLL